MKLNPQETLIKTSQEANEHSKNGQIQEAINLYREWLLQFPNLPFSLMAWQEYGRLLYESKQFSIAENTFKVILEKNYSDPAARLGLGLCLEAQGKQQEAVMAWEQGVQAPEVRIALLNNIGRVLEASHHSALAEEVLLKSLDEKIDQPEVISTLLHLRQRLCRWSEDFIVTPKGVKVKIEDEHYGPLAALAEFPDPHDHVRAAKNFLTSKGYDKINEALVSVRHRYPGHERIKVGFLSADFRQHATSVIFAPTIELLDRSRFEVYALDITTAPDLFKRMRARILDAVDHHLPLQNLSDLAAAQAIQDAEIDILVDMAGLTAGARPGIIAHHAAPLQVAYLGFLGSAGMKQIDYILTTEDMFDRENIALYEEKPLYLPAVYNAIELEEQPVPEISRAECELPEDAIVFCALLNPYKIKENVFRRWLKIVAAVPKGVLWLVADNEVQKANLLAIVKDQGIDSKKIVFTGRIMPDQYRARLMLADLFLDTSPYSNGSTAMECILAGLPIVTLPGKSMMSRYSAHLMNQLGLDGLAVDSWEEYEVRAIELGLHPEKLQSLKLQIRSSYQTNPLFDTKRFAQDFGSVLERIL